MLLQEKILKNFEELNRTIAPKIEQNKKERGLPVGKWTDK